MEQVAEQTQLSQSPAHPRDDQNGVRTIQADEKVSVRWGGLPAYCPVKQSSSLYLTGYFRTTVPQFNGTFEAV